MTKVVVLGSTGFIGAAATEALRHSGVDVQAMPAPRLLAIPGTARLIGSTVELEQQMDALVDQLTGCDVLLNAAGVANPTSRGDELMWGANAGLPGFLARAAERRGLRRIVHISSAAVQGRGRLTDDGRQSPLNSYARSKALGELAVIEAGPDRAVVYRPTSVHGPDRQLTQRIGRLARRGRLFVAGDGRRPTPQVLVKSVAQACVALCLAPDPPTYALHPWSGLSVGAFATTMGRGREPRRVPSALVRGIIAPTRIPVLGDRVVQLGRRIEVLALGQAQGMCWLGRHLGPDDLSAWRILADDLERLERTQDG